MHIPPHGLSADSRRVKTVAEGRLSQSAIRHILEFAALRAVPEQDEADHGGPEGAVLLHREAADDCAGGQRRGHRELHPHEGAL